MNRKWQRSTSKHTKKGRSPTGNGMQQGEERQKREKKQQIGRTGLEYKRRIKKTKGGSEGAPGWCLRTDSR